MTTKRAYTMTDAAKAQRLAASSAASVARPRREFATVRIERAVRDAAERVLRGGESLASFVGEAVTREVTIRGG